LLTELNGPGRREQITELQRKYRRARR